MSGFLFSVFPFKRRTPSYEKVNIRGLREKIKVFKILFQIVCSITKERQRLKQLEEERLAAEKAMKEVHDKLAAAEEASKRAAEEAKKKARELKTAVGLARTVGPNVPSWVTHRGLGAFCATDFGNKTAAAKAGQNTTENGEKTTAEQSGAEREQKTSEGETAEKSTAEQAKTSEEKTTTDQSKVEESQKDNEDQTTTGENEK